MSFSCYPCRRQSVGGPGKCYSARQFHLDGKIHSARSFHTPKRLQSTRSFYSADSSHAAIVPSPQSKPLHPRHVKAARSTTTRLPASSGPGEPLVDVPPPPLPPPCPTPQLVNQRLARRDVIAWVAVGTGLGALLVIAAQQLFDNREARQYEQIRLASGFKREADGHVWLRRKNGQWLEMRTDAKMPGTLLLRDDKGYIYFLGFNGIQQVDLTDDVVLAAVFGDGEWETVVQRVRARDVDGQAVDVQMDQPSFRNLISVMA